MVIDSRDAMSAAREEFRCALNAQKKQILICAGTGCVAGGSLKIYEKIRNVIEEKGLECQVRLEKEPHDGSIGLKKSGCHGFCEMGPLMRIEPMGWLYVKVKEEDCEEIVERTILHDEVVDRLVYWSLTNRESSGFIPF